MNEPIPEGLEIEELEPNLFKVSSPPAPHPDFEAVVLVAYPEIGVCTIRGIGRNLEGDGSGASIRVKVDEIASALSTKYGQPEDVDICVGGDIQCSNDFWMMILDNGERVYAKTWDEPNAEMQRLGIGYVAVAARALDIQTSYPLVEYHSINETQCKRAADTSSAQSL